MPHATSATTTARHPRLWATVSCCAFVLVVLPSLAAAQTAQLAAPPTPSDGGASDGRSVDDQSNDALSDPEGTHSAAQPDGAAASSPTPRTAAVEEIPVPAQTKAATPTAAGVATLPNAGANNAAEQAAPVKSPPVKAPSDVDASTQPPTASSWNFGAYGEMLLTTSFHHPDLKIDDPSYRDTHLDLARFSLFIGNDITRRISFSSEIEFEHGGTGAAREVEWEEFGEYETEIEKGGEIILEQAYLEGRPTDWLVLRGGHLLVPVGMTTQYHLPTLFSSTRRPESEARLIPSIWHENGIEAAVRIHDFAVRAQVITGLDSTGFSSARWIAGGTQRAFERPLVNDVATVLAADYLGIPNTVIGASLYTAGSNRNRPKRDLYDVGGRVTIGDLHARFQRGPLKLRGLVLLGRLQNAEAITRANATLSSNLGASRTAVASAAYAVWVEAAYDVLTLLVDTASHRMDLFARYDAYDSMWRAGADFDNPLLQARAVTGGVNYFPHPRVVIKAEYVSRWLNENNDWDRRQTEANAALGFVL